MTMFRLCATLLFFASIVVPPPAAAARLTVLIYSGSGQVYAKPHERVSLGGDEAIRIAALERPGETLATSYIGGPEGTSFELRPGVYLFGVSAPGFEPYEAIVAMGPESKTIRIALVAGQLTDRAIFGLRGQVLGRPNGAVWAQLTPIIQPSNTKRSVLLNRSVDEDGRFAFSVVDPMIYILSVFTQPINDLIPQLLHSEIVDPVTATNVEVRIEPSR